MNSDSVPRSRTIWVIGRKFQRLWPKLWNGHGKEVIVPTPKPNVHCSLKDKNKDERTCPSGTSKVNNRNQLALRKDFFMGQSRSRKGPARDSDFPQKGCLIRRSFQNPDLTLSASSLVFQAFPNLIHTPWPPAFALHNGTSYQVQACQPSNHTAPAEMSTSPFYSSQSSKLFGSICSNTSPLPATAQADSGT